MDTEEIINFVNMNGAKIGSLAVQGDYACSKLMRDYHVWFRAHANTENKLNKEEIDNTKMELEADIEAVRSTIEAPEVVEEVEE